MKDTVFGERLRSLREERGLTQQTASNRVGVSLRALQNNEGGQIPNQRNLNKYLEFYECDKAWLLTGQGEPYPEEYDAPLYSRDASNRPRFAKGRNASEAEPYEGNGQQGESSPDDIKWAINQIRAAIDDLRFQVNTLRNEMDEIRSEVGIRRDPQKPKGQNW